MAGDDREPIGRKGRPSRPTKQKVTRRRVREEDYDDEYDDDDCEDEKPVPRKAKGKGGKPRRKRSWLWLLVKLGIVFAVLIAAYGGNKGIDIAGTRGQPVYAAGAGKVVYVGNQLRGYGNLIMIKHSEDYITAYAHNDKLMVNNGQSVKAGQQIATMGSTDADSVRLHFQIRYRATAIDPLRDLPPQGSKPKC